MPVGQAATVSNPPLLTLSPASVMPAKTPKAPLAESENLPAERTKRPAATRQRKAAESPAQPTPDAPTAKRPAAKRDTPNWTGEPAPARLVKPRPHPHSAGQAVDINPTAKPRAKRIKLIEAPAPVIPDGHVKLASGAIVQVPNKVAFFNKDTKKRSRFSRKMFASKVSQ